MSAVASATMSGDHTAGRPAELLPRRGRWVRLAVFAVFVAIGLVRLNPNPPLAVAAAVVAIGAGVLLVDPRRPLLLGYAAVATAGIAVLGHGLASNVGWFAVCLLAGWCVLIGGRRDGLVFWVGTLLLFGGEWLWVQRDPGWGAWIAGTTLATLGGLFIRHEIDLVAQLRAAQADLTERVRVEERNRIARELHDVIAHTLTVSLLHITSARLAIEHEPADAARALVEAERLGRDSLAEVRSVVGLLHQHGQPDAAPLPGAGGIPSLVEQFRSAGGEVTLTIDGDTDRLPATTALAVYRIAQEALTNAVKHAPGAPVSLELCVDATSASLAVDSAGKPQYGRGLGLLSMRERAESLGGCCVAGAGGRGWLVRATLPLDAGVLRATK